jgi:hypothetical protein
MTDKKSIILVLAANPKDTAALRLDEELRDIREALKRSSHGGQFEIVYQPAARVADMRRAMLEHEPEIVHFCGHGEDGLVFEDASGCSHCVSGEALANFFKQFAAIRCVLLNACYSAPQAETIARHIDHVIGMKQAIHDQAAIEFAVAFYDGLGAGKPVERAFEIARASVDMLGIAGEAQKPVLHVRQQQVVETLAAPPEFSQITVCLAEATDDLYEQRRQIEDHFRAQGVQVSTDPNSGAQFFVQLLSAVSLREDGPSPARQYEAAKAVGLPLIQWRDSGLNLEHVRNPAQKALLEAATVMASDLPALKVYLNQKLQEWVKNHRRAAQKLESGQAPAAQLVFLNTALEDREYAEAIAEFLARQGYVPSLPLSGSDIQPREMVEDFEGNLRDCDLVILPYAQASAKWAREQLRLCVKFQAKRGGAYRLIGLCCHPSKQEKPELGMALSNLRILDCREIQDAGCLPAFLRELG